MITLNSKHQPTVSCQVCDRPVKDAAHAFVASLEDGKVVAVHGKCIQDGNFPKLTWMPLASFIAHLAASVGLKWIGGYK